ncbi:MAG: CoA-binding protein [Saprospiraceae bacterium]|nr:CoA-binding protein [Saprospiraceae bacterium]
MEGKKTLILGASPNPERYAYLAARSLDAHGHNIVAIGFRKGLAGPVEIQPIGEPLSDIDTITMYLNPSRQKEYYDYILETRPKRIIFNPGTENPELAALALEAGIEPVVACTLVMLSIGDY